MKREEGRGLAHLPSWADVYAEQVGEGEGEAGGGRG